MPAYPYNFPLVNPGAETGDNSGWVQISGGLGLNQATTDVHSGARRWAVGNVAAPHWGQAMQIPADYLADVDAGLAVVKGAVWAKGFSSDVDRASLILDCFDGGGINIGTRRVGQFDPTNWREQVVRMPVPVGARSIRISVLGFRVSGTENSLYLDDFSMDLETQPLVIFPHVFPAYNADFDEGWYGGWDIVTGTPTVLAGGYNGGLNHIRAGVVAFTQLKKDCILDPWYHAEIDTGQVNAVYSGWQITYDLDEDHGALYYECLDAANAILSTATGPSEQYDIWTRMALAFPIPAGTRTIRIGQKNTRLAGTNNDVQWDQFELLLTKAGAAPVGSRRRPLYLS